MRISFHGAAQTVTGSQHLLEINNHRILLECGLFQGRRKEAYQRNRNFAFDPGSIDAVILSHAHIDHSGNLPHLVKRGYRGPIYATDATAHLANIMLIDSGHIHESDAEYLNKKRSRRGEKAIEPLYTIEDAAQVAQYFECQPYERSFEVAPGVRAQLVEAGHILGSAAVVLDIEENGRRFRLWFSGDIGRLDLPLLRDPVLPEKADYLIMECTYGDKTHQTPQSSYEELQQVVERTTARGGKVIIPSFAVGRTQEIVYCLHRMIDGGEIPRIPVYIDSPLAVNVSDVFRAHPECFDEEAREFERNDIHRSVLGVGLVTYVRSVEGSKAINEDHQPMVIISASGMAEAGRILHHLRNNIEDSKNTVLIVSWQAPHTLGRRLAERVDRVKIFGEEFKRRAEVVTIGGFSAHASQPFLMDYALAARETVKRVFLVHGEKRGAAPLREKLEQAGMRRIAFPARHERVDLAGVRETGVG
jgi:metallo-beta-lactamase family protein